MKFLDDFTIVGRYFSYRKWLVKRDFIIEQQLPRWIWNIENILQTPYPSMQLNKLTLILIQISQSIMINWRDFQPMQWLNPYKGDCFSIVRSTLAGHWSIKSASPRAIIVIQIYFFDKMNQFKSNFYSGSFNRWG